MRIERMVPFEMNTAGEQPKRRWLTGAVLLLVVLLLVVVVGLVLSEHFKGRDVATTALDDEAQAAVALRGDAEDETKTSPNRIVGLRSSGTLPIGRTSWQDLDDPRKDGWDTEDFNNRAGAQLKKLGNLLAHPNEIRSDAIAPLVDERFSSGPLFPAALQTVYRTKHLRVERAKNSPTADRFRGAAGLTAALRALAQPLEGATETHVKFKLFRIAKTDGGLTTRQYFSLSGHTATGMIEQHATWVIRWSTDSSSAPRIESIVVTAFEQVTRSTKRWFVDCTDSVLSGNACYKPQLLQGYGHWLGRIPHGIYLESFGSPGMAVGDVNGDGLDDLYLCQERGLPNRLFLQQPDGTTREVSAAWEVDWLESSRSALLLDLDNDGDQDLVVAVMGGVVLASNEGGRRFQYRTLIPTTEDVMSLAAVDFDGDGDLDLYVCGYYADRTLDLAGDAGGSALPTGEAGFVMHDANTGGPSHLLRNDIRSSPQHWRFTDVTKQVGLDVNNRRYSFSAAWEDYDNDGDQDLYVANDFGRDNLYRNDAGKFVDVSDQAHIENAGTGMGITWGDFDRDGWMDAYVSNMFSAAGNRITFQDKFKPNAADGVKQRMQRLARGNTLLKNTGNGTFRDISARAGVEMGRWAWASLFVDLNNDGWEDLIVANGYITADDTGDL